VGDDNDLLWECGIPAVLPSLEYQISGTNTPLSYTWDGGTNALVIIVQTDGSGNAVSTASQIKALIDAVPYMHDRFRISLAAGNSGAGIVTVLSHTHFQYV
jgi:hypothetical protein